MHTTSRSGTTTFTTPSARELEMTRRFDAPRSRVFEAWTSPAHLPHWMLGPDGWTMHLCEIDLRPGGEWRFGWRRADGSGMRMHGVYREVVPHERLVTTESWGGGWPETLNTLLLSEEGGITTIVNRVLYPSREERDAASRTGMREGMSVSFDRLAAHLARWG